MAPLDESFARLPFSCVILAHSPMARNPASDEKREPCEQTLCSTRSSGDGSLRQKSKGGNVCVRWHIYRKKRTMLRHFIDKSPFNPAR